MKLFQKQPNKTHIDSTETQTAGKSQTITTVASKDKEYSAFLTRFLKPSEIHPWTGREAWQSALKTSYSAIIKYLLTTEDLRELDTLEGLQLLTVAKIKGVLQHSGLRVSGNKAELIQRLVENKPDTAKILAVDSAVESYVVTDSGRVKAETYVNIRDQREHEALVSALDHLSNNRIGDANGAINDYNKWLPEPCRNGIVTDDVASALYILQHASISWIVAELPTDIQRPFIIAAAAFALWSDHGPDILLQLNLPGDAQLKRRPIAYLRLLDSLAHNHFQLEEAQKNEYGFYTGEIEIRTVNDSYVCQTCSDVATKTYSLSNVPMLPHPCCTDPDGCRCTYSPRIAVPVRR